MQRRGGQLPRDADAAPTHRPQQPGRGTAAQRARRHGDGTRGLQHPADLESGPIRVLRSLANGIGSGPQLRMPAFEVMT